MIEYFIIRQSPQQADGTFKYVIEARDEFGSVNPYYFRTNIGADAQIVLLQTVKSHHVVIAFGRQERRFLKEELSEGRTLDAIPLRYTTVEERIAIVEEFDALPDKPVRLLQ